MFLDGLMQIGWAEEHYMSSSSSTDYDDNDVSVIMQPSPLTTSYTSSDANYGSNRNTDNNIDEDNDNKNTDSRTDVDIDIDISGENNNNNHCTVENGIGDDKYSWSYDGYRQVKWYNGKSINYGPQTKIIWKIGDVIGCLLELSDNDDDDVTVGDDGGIVNDGDNAIAGDDNKSKIVVGIDEVNNKIITTEIIVDDINIGNNSDKIVNTIKVTMTYYVNGISYGIAHQFYMQNKYHHHQQQQQQQQQQLQPFSFFPALSIENNESIALNLGNYIINL